MPPGHHHPPDLQQDAARSILTRERALRRAVVVTLGFALVEAAGGWITGSLALLADAGHMTTDAAALLAAWLATRWSQRPPSARMTFGYRRAEVLAALGNALLMLVLIGVLVAAAIGRLQAPRSVDGAGVMVIALFGLVVNLLVLRILSSGDRRALNTRGARLHVIGDTLGSVAALVAGLVIWSTGWTPIDPLLSLFIAALILVSALRLVADVFHVLMEAVPARISVERVKEALLALDGIDAVHDLHVWTLAGDRLLLSAHLGIAQDAEWPGMLIAAQSMLRDQFDIAHATLQPEPPEYAALAAARQEARPLDDHAH
jgi:cobalt-zinc-cadmium efflux system protein